MVDINKFTTGLIAGSIVGAIGLTFALSDKRTRNKMMKDGRKLVTKAGHKLEDVTDYMW